MARNRFDKNEDQTQDEEPSAKTHTVNDIPKSQSIMMPGGASGMPGDLPLMNDSVVAGSAVGADAAKAPQTKRFKVTQGGMAMIHGYRAKIAPGKIVDGLNYNLASLEAQGIRFQPIEE